MFAEFPVQRDAVEVNIGHLPTYLGTSKIPVGQSRPLDRPGYTWTILAGFIHDCHSPSFTHSSCHIELVLMIPGWLQELSAANRRDKYSQMTTGDNTRGPNLVVLPARSPAEIVQAALC